MEPHPPQEQQQPNEHANGDGRVMLRPGDVDSCCVCIIMPGIPAGISSDTYQVLEGAQGARTLFHQLGVRFDVAPVQGLSYEHALAESCAIAMQHSDAKRLFFLDTDMSFDARWIAMMCAMDLDVVAGTYQQRTSQGEWCVNTTERGIFEGSIAVEPRTGQRIVAINNTGFGAVCVRRTVIEKLQRLHHDNRPGKGLNYVSMNPLVEKPAYALWDPWIWEHGSSPGVRRRCAGDTNFFKRVRDAGYQPYAPLDMEINHARLGLKSLAQWVAQKQQEAAETLARLRPGQMACGRCGGMPAPYLTVEGHGDPSIPLCKSCAEYMPTGKIRLASLGSPCSKCGAPDAPFLEEGDGTPGSDARLCRACAA